MHRILITTIFSLLLVAAALNHFKYWPFFYLYPAPTNIQKYVNTTWLHYLQARSITDLCFGGRTDGKFRLPKVNVDTVSRSYTWQTPTSTVDRICITISDSTLRVYWQVPDNLNLSAAQDLINANLIDILVELDHRIANYNSLDSQPDTP